MLIQKREKKSTNSSEALANNFAACPIDHKLEAINCIECAIEHLAEVPDCPDCLESIGNLSIVLMDLKAE